MPPKRIKKIKRPRKKAKAKAKPKTKTITKVVYKNVGQRETLPIVTTQTSYSKLLQNSYDSLRNPNLQFPVVPQAPQSSSFDKYMELITAEKLEQHDREKLERLKLEQQQKEQLQIEDQSILKKPTGLKALQMNELLSNADVLQDNNVDPRNNLELIKFSNKLNNMKQEKFQDIVKKYDTNVNPNLLQKSGVKIEEVKEDKPKKSDLVKEIIEKQYVDAQGNLITKTTNKKVAELQAILQGKKTKQVYTKNNIEDILYGVADSAVDKSNHKSNYKRELINSILFNKKFQERYYVDINDTDDVVNKSYKWSTKKRYWRIRENIKRV